MSIDSLTSRLGSIADAFDEVDRLLDALTSLKSASDNGGSAQGIWDEVLSSVASGGAAAISTDLASTSPRTRARNLPRPHPHRSSLALHDHLRRTSQLRRLAFPGSEDLMEVEEDGMDVQMEDLAHSMTALQVLPPIPASMDTSGPEPWVVL